MKKVATYKPDTFEKEVADYQNRIFYSNRGRSIRQAASTYNIELTPQQVAYIHSVMAVSDHNFVDFGMGYVDISVQLLFCFMTPFSVDTYEDAKAGKGSKHPIKYMAEVTRNCIEPLGDIVFFQAKREGQCRKFAIVKEFGQRYYLAQQEVLEKVDYKLEGIDEEELYRGSKKAPRGIGFEHVDRINPVTIQTLDKLQESRFVFDAHLYNSTPGKDFIKSKNLKPDQIDSLNCALEFINTGTATPQYHDSFHLQDAGRMHTVGGCIQMPKWFRDKFILPVDPRNVRVEFDLKCAQLLILCDILGTTQLKKDILQILDREGSVWKRIGDPDLDKRVKKIIVYAFAFGGEIKSLPFLASREARQRDLDITVTSKDVSCCLGSLLKPLAEAREAWLANYTVEKIIKSRGPRKIDNALGYSFDLYREAVKFAGARPTSSKLKSTKIASQLLAHLAQGQEQLIVQTLIANHVEGNILTFQYDGWTLEVEPDKVDSVIHQLSTNCPSPIEYSIVN